MKLFARPRIELLYANDNLIIPVKKGQVNDLTQFIERLGQLDLDKDYIVKIENKASKRSLDANAYFWVLVRELAKKLNKSNIEVYKHLIQESGTYTVLGMAADSYETFARSWESNGDGWICVSIGESKSMPNYSFVKAYPGSSTYNTKEMSRLIDAVVEECKEQNIETMTPQEIERLKNEWR